MMEEYILRLIDEGRRVDNRDFLEYRKIEVVPNVIKRAEGSASVKIGNTHLIAGVKMEIGKPFPDSPEEGILVVNAEFPPLASPEFELGPPGEDAIELARVVDRAIRSAETIELKKLKIEEEKVWCVFVDIHVINDDGNLLDAASLAAISALLNTQIPKIEGEKIIREEFTGKLPVVNKPIIVSVCRVGNKLILDPNAEEEKILDSKLSFGIDENGKICAIQKQGKPIKFNNIEKMLDIAIEKSKELRKCL